MERLLKYLKVGHHVCTACRAAGISQTTFFDWCNKGRRAEPGDEAYVAFLDAVDDAMVQAEDLMLRLVRRAAATQWQAAAWWLERRHPRRWGTNSDVNDEDGTTTHRPIIQIVYPNTVPGPGIPNDSGQSGTS